MKRYHIDTSWTRAHGTKLAITEFTGGDWVLAKEAQAEIDHLTCIIRRMAAIISDFEFDCDSYAHDILEETNYLMPTK